MARRDDRRLGGLILLGVLLAAPASAQDTERARQLFEQGVSAMEGGDPRRAAAYFDESYSIYPRASTACNMAVAQERLNAPCDAQRWYQQCAALDRAGRFRDHANRQAAALGAQCAARPAPGIQQTYVPPPNSQVQIVESQPIAQFEDPAPDHTLLGVAIGALVLGAGGLVGAIVAQEAAWGEYWQISVDGGALVEGSEDAQHFEQASLLSDVALGLYVGAGVFGGLGVIFLIVDLAQPGVFGTASLGPQGLRVRF